MGFENAPNRPAPKAMRICSFKTRLLKKGTMYPTFSKTIHSRDGIIFTPHTWHRPFIKYRENAEVQYVERSIHTRTSSEQQRRSSRSLQLGWLVRSRRRPRRSVQGRQNVQHDVRIRPVGLVRCQRRPVRVQYPTERHFHVDAIRQS